MSSRPSQYAIGADIGQAADFSALCVIKRVPKFTGNMRTAWKNNTNQVQEFEYEDHFLCGRLERMPLRTPYASVVVRVTEMAQRLDGGVEVVMDQTGVGRPVVEMASHLPLVPVTITGAQGTTADYDGWKVGKRVLVSNAQVLMQQQRLVFSSQLPLIDELVKELNAFKVRLSQVGNQTFESWREGIHDDLVLSVCLAAWWLNRFTTGWLSIPPDQSGKPTEQVARHLDQYALAARKHWSTKK